MHASSDTPPRSPVEVDDRPAARQPTRVWVYTQSVKGMWQKVHRASGLVLQAVLVLVPWITVGGHPAFQIDLAGRRLYALGEVFTPRETIFLVLMLMFGAFSLFFFTALFGRLWCGYACPQTVFLEEWVRPVEKWLEGERGLRMLRDKKGLTFDSAWRKGVKWLLFLALSVAVSMSFVAWFAGARPLWTGQSGVAAYGVVTFLSAVMFVDLAWFREQFCNYLCPYARFQGALCDDHSLVVAYQEARGEPRGKPLKGSATQAPAAVGACIDCKKCVAVCPQGIDIRDGFQLECITCGRCVDACTGVMEKSGQPSLITYTQLEKGPIIRPRTVVYATLLTAIAALFVGLLATRHDLDANIVRAPGTLFTVDSDGWVRNTYLLRITNTDAAAAEVEVEVEGLPDGADDDIPAVALAAEETRTVPVVLRVPPGSVRPGAPIPLTVELETERDRISLPATFAGGS